MLAASLFAVTVLAQPAAAPAPAVDRTVLPIAEPERPHLSVLDVRDATPPALALPVQAPARAPNILIILLDDMGFGQSSAFGGPVHMPALESLAARGNRYNNFHTTALCSPTRAALLTGRNHHNVETGSIMESATVFPGDTGRQPSSAASIAEVLRLNGYATGAFGKWHQTPAADVSAVGPFGRWPTGAGFDKFYGFVAGETNQWSPTIYDGTSQVEPPRTPGYHFLTDMTDRSIGWLRSISALAPDKPFFLYYAPGATHAPHHVAPEWSARYRGKFDAGWDAMREQTLARQIALGVVPKGTALAPRPNDIRAWDALSADEKRLFARQMEVFAGFAEMTDHEAGRLIDTLKQLGRFDNTLIFYVVGDNGASAEGGAVGLVNENSYFNGVPEPVEEQLKQIDQLGGPSTYNHYASGWAFAGDAPFSWTKQVASDFGGTRNGLVVSWPGHLGMPGLRTQFHHVIDIVPTMLEAAGLPAPVSVNGVRQIPLDGVSMEYSFADPKAADRHTTQYFEMFGNRALYQGGWLARTIHLEPWAQKPRAPLAEDIWELFDTRRDFSLAHDVAAQYPERLKAMQQAFLAEAVKYHVLPLDDRRLERLNAALVGRPDLMAGRTSLTLYPGMTAMSENTFLNIKNRSFAITADLAAGEGGTANGAIVAQGGRFGGWSLYLKDGKPAFTYNFLGRRRFTIAAPDALPAGATTLRFAFAYDGGKLGAGGTGRLSADGKLLAEGRIDMTQPIMFSADDGADVGTDTATPVIEDYGAAGPAFTGTIRAVTIDIAPLMQAAPPPAAH
ncbi:arylsulfatase [Sphingopyxis sp.]|uniref:arylsulfatase n=1 Tax=Sphingopyxis sp. TaxID=1908224 RepID=UPI0026029B8F|nr:arylsulfatase [Sphingopyxis sp.]MCW0200046.1 arylsulfatase [Sphingopyxis sp.]